jgi:hypothetical protein
MKSLRRILVALLGSVVFVSLALSLSPYSPKEFRGAGPMEDDGPSSYFRYHAPLGEVPLAVEGRYTFRFSGLPEETMGLQFYLPGYSEEHDKLLRTLSTTLTVEIVDGSGNRTCIATGRPSGTTPPETWVLMSSSLEAGYWHHGCVDRHFSRGMKYTLRVKVENVDPNSPQVVMKAVLEGGGNELP